MRRLFRNREKCLILLVFFTLVFLCFGGFFYLPDDFGSDRVLKVYKQFQKAGPEIFIPAPPVQLANPLGPPDEHYQRRIVVGDRAKLNAKIEEELGRDALEKPDTGRSEDEAAGQAAVVRVEAPVMHAPAHQQLVAEADDVGTSADGSQVGRSPMDTSPAGKTDRWFVNGEDPDASVRQKRDKVKEVSVPVLD